MGNICLSKNNHEEKKEKAKETFIFSENNESVIEPISDLIKEMKIKEPVSQVKFIPRNIFGYLDPYKYKIYGDCRRIIIFETPGIYKIFSTIDSNKRIVSCISKYHTEKIEYIILYPYGSTIKRIPNTLQLITNCKNISIVTNFPHEVY